MSGGEASSSGAGSGSGGAAIPYDYSSNISKHERSANYNKPPMFNGDPKMFSWCKSKMYSHIIGMDEELWDILQQRLCSPLCVQIMRATRKSKRPRLLCLFISMNCLE